MSEWTIKNEAKYKAEKDQAFEDLMKALKPYLKNDKEYNKFIQLWVDATFAAFWEGWYSYTNTDIKEAN